MGGFLWCRAQRERFAPHCMCHIALQKDCTKFDFHIVSEFVPLFPCHTCYYEILIFSSPMDVKWCLVCIPRLSVRLCLIWLCLCTVLFLASVTCVHRLHFVFKILIFLTCIYICIQIDSVLYYICWLLTCGVSCQRFIM